MDYGHKLTDNLLAETEDKINVIYDKAAKEAKQKAEKYLDRFKEQDSDMRKKLDNGDITDKEYQEWRTRKLIGDSKYKSLAEGLATDMTNANKLAASVINGHLPDVYATNYNWGTYKIEQDARIDTNFMIYDRQTVERLIRDNPDLIPVKAKIKVPKDKLWNKQKINDAVTQGILLGDSIPNIAKRLAAVTDMNRTSAIRNARTMTTSAESGGRIDSYKRATDMGIIITQEWLATNDGRTRHEHTILNGQQREVGEPFEVEGNKIAFPGDPEAEPFLVYNCRCTLISKFKGFDYKKMDEYVEEKPMSYKEWKKQHQQAKEPPKSDRPPTKEGWLYETASGYSEKDIEAMNQIVEAAPEQERELWELYAPTLQKPLPREENQARAYFRPKTGRVHLDNQEVAAGDVLHTPFENHFHEYAHNIDYLAGEGHNHFSDTWTDDKGRKLEDIIMNEWNEKFGEKRADWEIAQLDFAELLKSQYVKDNQALNDELYMKLKYWRRSNKISKDDETYLKLKNELQGYTTKAQMLDFYKRNADKMLSDRERKGKEYNINADAVKNYIRDIRNEYSLRERGILSDMFERFTATNLDIEYPLGAGHGKVYAKTTNNLSNEAFAEFVDSSFTNLKALELVKEELPESYEAYNKMLSDLLRRPM